jgi:hypothetical protein
MLAALSPGHHRKKPSFVSSGPEPAAKCKRTAAPWDV